MNVEGRSGATVRVVAASRDGVVRIAAVMTGLSRGGAPVRAPPLQKIRDELYCLFEPWVAFLYESLHMSYAFFGSVGIKAAPAS